MYPVEMFIMYEPKMILVKSEREVTYAIAPSYPRQSASEICSHHQYEKRMIWILSEENWTKTNQKLMNCIMLVIEKLMYFMQE